MKSTQKNLLWIGSFLAVAIFAAPGLVEAYQLLGGNLGIGTSGNGFQRDVRILNNAADSAANNNTTPDANYPGALGAAMAVWKGTKAWSSDMVNANLPGGVVGKNFDMDWQGTAASNLSNQNTAGWTGSCGSGVLAFTETPISDGWRMQICDNSWVWADGPGSPSGGQIDIQGVVAHEYGHSLGMNHPDNGNEGGPPCNTGCTTTRPTMCAFICGNGSTARDIATDDANGLQAIYGVAPANKPKITSLAGSFANGGTLLINGTNFAATVNVKFTAGTTQNTGTIPGVVYNVASSGGGTQISVVIPAAAQDGNVLVWEPSMSLLSNAFPIDINFVPPPPPSITGVSPPDVQAFQGGIITLTGSGFTGATQVNSGGNILTPPFGATVVDDNTITYGAPTASALGSTTVTVTTPNGTSNNGSFNYIETDPPQLSAAGFAFSNNPFTWSYGGKAGDTAFLIYAFSPTTFTYQGFPILSSFNILFTSTLDTVGLGSLTVGIPASAAGITLYSQVITFDGGGAGFVGASTIPSTFFF